MWLRTCKRTVFRELKKLASPYLWTVDAINGVDELVGGAVTFIPEVERFLIISGWCVATRKNRDIEELKVIIGDRHYPALHGLIRTDVSKEFRDRRYRYSGFRCLIPREEVVAGQTYAISLEICSGGDKRVVATGVSFAVDGARTRGKTFTSSEQLDFSQYRGELMARQYIAGTGIEIGALHAPMSVDRAKATVLYVDRLPLDQLYHQYPEFKKYDIVAPDIIDGDGELTAVGDDCYDFCISNHVLEHLEDPFKALLNWLRVLKPGGILYLSIPLPDNIVDRRRQATTFDHLLKDHRLPEKDDTEYLRLRAEHFFDFVRGAEMYAGKDDAFCRAKAEELLTMNYSIHYHVFAEEVLRQLLAAVDDIVPHKLVEFFRNEPEEYIVILEKGATAQAV
jgi:SAM-dependent methyltransferase